MSANRRDFDKAKCMSFLIKDKKLLEKYNEIWKKSATLSKENLTVNLYTMKNIKKLKLNLIMEKSTQFSQ